MAQYIIPATFADDSGYKAGLSPIITIREWDDKDLIYIDKITETMEDKGIGDYVYRFIEYDKSKLYTYKIDGGSDELTSRYLTGNNELDYYSNKVDRGSQFRGAIGGFSDGFYKEIKKLNLLLEELKGKDVDLSEVLLLLNEIKSKEYPTQDNEEIIEKIYELGDNLSVKFDGKNDKVEIISAIKNNKPDLTKVNKENREIINKLLEQQKEDGELIKDLKNYIEKLIKRGDIEKDSGFKKLIKEINESENNIKELAIYMDQDFISLVS